MKSPELSISFRSEPNELTLQATATVAAHYGFDVISVYEDLGDQSPMYPLMTFARSTAHAVMSQRPYLFHRPAQHTRLGPAGIVVPKYASMEPIVGDIARLNSINPNKTYLGFVPGAWMEKIGLKSATVQQMREAAEVARYMLDRRDDGYEGKYYNVQAGFTVNYATPSERVPFLVGAWGENMAALAGEIADEIKVGGSANPEMIPIIKQRIAVGAKRAGRPTESIGIVMGAVTVVDEERGRALAHAREKAVLYIEAIGDKDPTVVSDFSDEIRAIKVAIRNGDIPEAVRNLPDALLKRFAFAGTPDDIILQVEELFENGATRVEFGTPHGIRELEGIELLGERVLPYFKQ